MALVHRAKPLGGGNFITEVCTLDGNYKFTFSKEVPKTFRLEVRSSPTSVYQYAFTWDGEKLMQTGLTSTTGATKADQTSNCVMTKNSIQILTANILSNLWGHFKLTY